MRGLEGATIGRLSVVNPDYADSVGMSNEELLYNWKELNRHHSVPVDRISNGTIKFATRYEILKQTFSQVLTEGSDHGWKDGYQVIGQIRSCVTVLDENTDTSVDDKIKALAKLLHALTKESTEFHKTNIFDRTYSTQAELNNPEIRLYNSILFAIG